MQHKLITTDGPTFALGHVPAELKAGDVVAIGGRELVVLDRPARYERHPLLVGDAWVRVMVAEPAAR